MQSAAVVTRLLASSAKDTGVHVETQQSPIGRHTGRQKPDVRRLQEIWLLRGPTLACCGLSHCVQPLFYCLYTPTSIEAALWRVPGPSVAEPITNLKKMKIKKKKNTRLVQVSHRSSRCFSGRSPWKKREGRRCHRRISQHILFLVPSVIPRRLRSSRLG